jgi:hypothetical protein
VLIIIPALVIGVIVHFYLLAAASDARIEQNRIEDRVRKIEERKAENLKNKRFMSPIQAIKDNFHSLQVNTMRKISGSGDTSRRIQPRTPVSILGLNKSNNNNNNNNNNDNNSNNNDYLKKAVHNNHNLSMASSSHDIEKPASTWHAGIPHVGSGDSIHSNKSLSRKGSMSELDDNDTTSERLVANKTKLLNNLLLENLFNRSDSFTYQRNYSPRLKERRKIIDQDQQQLEGDYSSAHSHNNNSNTNNNNSGMMVNGYYDRHQNRSVEDFIDLEYHWKKLDLDSLQLADDSNSSSTENVLDDDDDDFI